MTGAELSACDPEFAVDALDEAEWSSYFAGILIEVARLAGADIPDVEPAD